MKKSIIKAIALVAMLGTGSMVYAANGGSFAIKAGNFTLSEKSQNIAGVNTVFDDSSSSVFALEYEKQLRNNVAWGVELINYSNDVVFGIGDVLDTVVVMGNGKKYFDASNIVKPYIGGGVGISALTLNEGSASGIAFQAMAGIKFPFKKISAFVEYKLISSEAEDVDGEKVDVSGSGIFAGIAINF